MGRKRDVAREAPPVTYILNMYPDLKMLVKLRSKEKKQKDAASIEEVHPNFLREMKRLLKDLAFDFCALGATGPQHELLEKINVILFEKAKKKDRRRVKKHEAEDAKDVEKLEKEIEKAANTSVSSSTSLSSVIKAKEKKQKHEKRRGKKREKRQVKKEEKENNSEEVPDKESVYTIAREWFQFIADNALVPYDQLTLSGALFMTVKALKTQRFRYNPAEFCVMSLYIMAYRNREDEKEILRAMEGILPKILNRWMRGAMINVFKIKCAVPEVLDTRYFDETPFEMDFERLQSLCDDTAMAAGASRVAAAGDEKSPMPSTFATQRYGSRKITTN